MAVNKRTISSLTKRFNTTDDIVRSAAKKMGYKSTGKNITSAGKKIDMTVLGNTITNMSSKADDLKHAFESGQRLGTNTKNIYVAKDSKFGKEYLKNSIDILGTGAGNVEDVLEKTIKDRTNKQSQDITRKQQRIKRAKNINEKGNILPSSDDVIELGSSSNNGTGSQFKKSLEEKIAQSKVDSRIKALDYYRDKGIDLEDVTDDMLDKRIADMKKETINKRIHIGETSAENELKNKLARESADPMIPKTGSSSNTLKGQYPETKKGIRELHDNRRDSKEAWLQNKYSKQYMNAMKDLEKGNYNNEILDGYIKNGMSKKELTKDFLSTERAAAIETAGKRKMGLSDTMEYYKIPQYAVMGGTTMWLVNKMASNGGQQTNSQLYGQSQY